MTDRLRAGRVIVMVAALVANLAAHVALFFALASSQAPVTYQGKTLEVWFYWLRTNFLSWSRRVAAQEASDKTRKASK